VMRCGVGEVSAGANTTVDAGPHNL
jgi:hypothetical protein